VDALVRMKGISKKFPGVVALDNINFDLQPGEVHVILGENGAGKSTLMKILSGAYEPSAGTIEIQGATYHSLTPSLSARVGIAIIYQELSVINELTIAENLFLGRLPEKRLFNFAFPIVDKKALHASVTAAIAKVGLHRKPDEFVRNLSISEKQLVEIAKALTSNARIIIMDEPTSSLTIEETNKLFEIIRTLKADGVGIIYISHKLDEIPQIGDRVTVLKDGHYVGTRNVSDISTDEMITMMVGRELDRTTKLKPSVDLNTSEVIFSIRGLSRQDRKIENIDFDLKRGEILGFSGLIGAGRTEMMEAIFGIAPIKSGRIVLHGKTLDHSTPYKALKNKIAFITENRRESGFFSNFSVLENMSIIIELIESKANGLVGLVHKKRNRAVSENQRQILNIRCASIDQSINDLSGGNQQKVLIAKWLAAEPDIMIFDEPTKGIDVGSKAEIYHILRKLADSGKGVMIVSSELPELLYICDRIIVFANGHKTAEFSADEATEEKIMRAAAFAH